MIDRTTRITNLPDRIWATISKIDELKGGWIVGARLSPQTLGRLKKSVLITSSGASTRIEGSRLSDEEVERLMSGLTTKKFVDRDEQEVRGYYELLDNVFASAQRLSLSESSIKHFHKELLKYSDKDDRHRGEYKKTENHVEMFDEAGHSLGVVFETTPAYLTPKQMQELVDWTRDALARRELHPLLIIGNFLVEFLAIHPFQDGNGRLSRLLVNLLMLRAGYAYAPYASHEKLVEDRKTDYYLALRRSQQSIKDGRGDITPWLEFLLDVSLAQARQAIELLSRENIDKLLSPKQLIVWQYIASQAEATPKDIAAATGTATPTISQALLVLLRLKKIERLGQGRTTRYRKI